MFKLNTKISPDLLRTQNSHGIITMTDKEYFHGPHKGEPPESCRSPGVFCLPSSGVPVKPSAHKMTDDMCGNRHKNLYEYFHGRFTSFALDKGKEDGASIIPYFDSIRKEAVSCPQKS